MVQQLEIIRASLEDKIEILAPQKLTYQSEAQIDNYWTIPPLIQTSEKIQEEFSTHIFLKTVIAFNCGICTSSYDRHYLPHRQANRIPKMT